MLDAAGSDRIGSDQDILGLFENVRGMASNSGGSWFLTQLAYSEDFKDALEDHRDDWMSETGYMGKIETKLDLENIHPSMYTVIGPISDHRGYWAAMRVGSPEGDKIRANWGEFVRKGVFHPFDMTTKLADTKLSGDRNPWAVEKDLIFAAGLMTTQVVLSHNILDLGRIQNAKNWMSNKYRYQYYDAVAGSRIPEQKNFTPLFLGSVAEGNIVPTWLVDDFTVTYKTLHKSGPQFSEGLDETGPAVEVAFSRDQPNYFSKATVIGAASASSAAMAAGAGHVAAKDASLATAAVPSWGLSWECCDLAPAVRVEGTDISFLELFPSQETSGHGEDKSFRVADGGYLDNSAAIYLLKHMQNNDLMENFSLVLFINNTESKNNQKTVGAHKLPSSLANIFGVPAPNDAGTIEMSDRVVTMSPKVFDASPWDSATPLWTKEEPGTNMRYFKLDVTTVENRTWQVDAGHSGTLHIFINNNPESGPMPSNSEGFDTYAKVYSGTRAAVTTGGGWAWLQQALELD